VCPPESMGIRNLDESLRGGMVTRPLESAIYHHAAGVAWVSSCFIRLPANLFIKGLLRVCDGAVTNSLQRMARSHWMRSRQGTGNSPCTGRRETSPLSGRWETPSAALGFILSACASHADRRHCGVLYIIRLIPQDSPALHLIVLQGRAHKPVYQRAAIPG